MPSQQMIAQRQVRHERRMTAAAAIVPQGSYCYCYTPIEPRRRADGLPIMKVKHCPFLKRRGDWPEQMNGYCRLLKSGDNSQGRDRSGNPRATSLLWDGVKECGLNLGPDEFKQE